MAEPDDPFLIKICGLTTPETLEVALDAGADMIGLNFHRKSPRYVAPDVAATLAVMARGRAESVALLVDPSADTIDHILTMVDPDMIQLHGQETPHRVADIRAQIARPVMKAIGISTADDLAQIEPYWTVSDRLLLDAKPPKDAAYPGGHGQPFDWALLDGMEPPLPFMLAGGLNPDTVAGAITRVKKGGARLIGVDVSSGVESAPGVKDTAMIRAFIAAAREAAGA